MPCYDGREEEERRVREAKLKITTRLACDYCRHLESNDMAIPSYAKAWWDDHKRYDKAQGR